MITFLNSVLFVLHNSAQTLLLLSPYIILGVVLGEILKLTSWTKLIYKGVSKSPFLATLLAVVLGMVSPLCTYGTVPMVLQLYRAGISITPLIVFLSSSSLMNPQLFIWTWSWLGPEMALMRVAAVLAFGLFLGLILHRIPPKWIVNGNISVEAQTGEDILNRPKKVFKWQSFLKDNWKSLQYVGFYMIIGIVIGAVIEAVNPGEWLRYTFKPGAWLSYFTAALLSVPLYACGGGVLPTISDLIQQGMSKGSALVFLTVGQATRPTPLIALATLLRPLFIFAYVILLIGFSVIAGFIYH